MTSEAGGSLWDCGEFVSSCFKVQIPHPPGAPLFVLIGRVFIVLFGDDPMKAAKAVNIMSALASGFCILFLFWSITHFARRIVQGAKNIDALDTTQIMSIMAAGIVGALGYAFTDSFWYSAVEGEVYALSAFFTAIIFWAILKWEHVADEPGADRWIVFIFFMMGLSIGVHLLGLLTIPGLVMVYYFRKRQHFNYQNLRKYFIWVIAIGGILAVIGAFISASGDVTENLPDMDSTVPGVLLFATIICIALLYVVEYFGKDNGKKELYGGAYIFLVIGAVLLGVVQKGVTQYSIMAAGKFDIFFVDRLGLPFFSGFAVFFILLGIVIWYLLRVANKKRLAYLRLAMWCLAFMLIGYSSYLTTMIRSNADPSVDMFNVDNPMSLVGYLGRDQYGDFPLLYGQKFTAYPVDMKSDNNKYQKGKDEAGRDKYITIGKDFHYLYSKDDKMIFPRMWNTSDDRNQRVMYALAVNMDIQQDKNGQLHFEDGRPTFMDNLRFFVSYQNYYMFIRYFLWNYSGRQNDIQGTSNINARDGNWITGIPIVDNMIYGDQSLLPDSAGKNNKGHNTMFMLPLILGIIGLIYQLVRNKKDWMIVFLLFYMTGFAIIIYLNQAMNEPRERDYAFAGATYAFAIWIGIGVLQVRDWFSKITNIKTATALATVVCVLAVPVLIAQQEWNDHDRSSKQVARDVAKDYLESCAKNAILFTFGDNDTYPLWYAQEVEHIRPDIRVINTSLLGIDWYINDLRNKVNESDSIDVIWNIQQIQGQKRDAIFYQPKPQFPQNRFYDLYDMMQNYAGKDDPDKMYTRNDGQVYNTFPVLKVSVPVNKDSVLNNGTVNPTDSIADAVNFEIPKRVLMKNETAILNIIAANKWKRPVYFTNYYDELGFGGYLRRDGLTFRLIPVYNSHVNTDWMYKTVMDKNFGFGNMNISGVYADEENRRNLNFIRQAFGELAMDLVEKNRKDDARKALNRVDNMMLQENIPYGMVSRYNQHNKLGVFLLQAAYGAEDKDLAAKITKSLKTDLNQQMKYYNSLDGWRADGMVNEKETANRLLQSIDALEKQYLGNPKAVENGTIITNPDSSAPVQPTQDTSGKKKK
jgi:hypothetical protein